VSVDSLRASDVNFVRQGRSENGLANDTTNLALKGLSARAIHEDLTTTLGLDAVAYSLVTRYLREARLFSSSQGVPSADVDRGIDDADQALPSSLDENRFASVRQLSRRTHIPGRPPTVVSRNHSGSQGVIFDGCPMPCQACRTPVGSICPGNRCQRSKSSKIEHGMTSSHSTSHGSP
jgi:hypothetical protein